MRRTMVPPRRNRKSRAIVHVDDDEIAMLGQFRKLRQEGFGKLEIVVAGGKLDIMHQTISYKPQDVVKESEKGT